MPPLDSNGWNEWRNHVLAEMERIAENQNELRADIQKIHLEVEMLKAKSGMWGMVGGLVPAAATLIYWLVKK